MTTEEGEKSLTEQVLDFDSVVEIVPIDSEATWFDMPMAALGSRCASQPRKLRERNSDLPSVGKLHIQFPIGEANGLCRS